MPLTSLLLDKLISEYSDIHFETSDTHHWSPSAQTVYFAPLKTEEDIWSLLHEIAHALLKHQDYTRDVELLTKEAEAWHYAKTAIGPKYNVSIDEDYAEDQLDSYRQWLHSRSLCPTCKQTGVQTKKSTYSCINCGTLWKVNDARTCALRRYHTSAK